MYENGLMCSLITDISVIQVILVLGKSSRALGAGGPEGLIPLPTAVAAAGDVSPLLVSMKYRLSTAAIGSVQKL